MNQRLLVSMVEPVQVGYEFKRSEWPLHLTIVPWFTVKDQNWFTTGLVKVLDHQKPIQLVMGEKEMFGAKRNVPVNIITPNDELSELHEKLLSLVREWGELQGSKFIEAKYRPHVTHHRGNFLTSGSEWTLDNICIVELINESTCRVAARYEF